MAEVDGIRQDVRQDSWLKFCKLEKVEEPGTVVFWAPFEAPEIKDQDSDTEYVVKNGDRIDLLAQKAYGSPYLWWVIAAKNDLVYPAEELKQGMTIILPNRDYVLKELLLRGS